MRQMPLLAGENDDDYNIDDEDDVHLRKLWCSTKTASFSMAKQKVAQFGMEHHSKRLMNKYIGSNNFLFYFLHLLFISFLCFAQQDDHWGKENECERNRYFNSFTRLHLFHHFVYVFPLNSFFLFFLLKCSSFLYFSVALFCCCCRSPMSTKICVRWIVEQRQAFYVVCAKYLSPLYCAYFSI